jgi:hypothetical protein
MTVDQLNLAGKNLGLTIKQFKDFFKSSQSQQAT